MVIRSSFGIFYAQDQGTGVTNRMTSNPPFFGYGAQTISSDQLFPSTGFVLNPGVRSPRPAPIDPAAFMLVSDCDGNARELADVSEDALCRSSGTSASKNDCHGIWLRELNYVGNHGVQLYGIGEGNQPSVLNVDDGNIAASAGTVHLGLGEGAENWNMSNYQGLSAKLEKRFSRASRS